jgi:hypothetical protein
VTILPVGLIANLVFDVTCESEEDASTDNEPRMPEAPSAAREHPTNPSKAQGKASCFLGSLFLCVFRRHFRNRPRHDFCTIWWLNDEVWLFLWTAADELVLDSLYWAVWSHSTHQFV